MKLTYVALLLVSVATSAAQAEPSTLVSSKSLVTQTNLDKDSQIVRLKQADGGCRFAGALTRNQAGDFEVVIERKYCTSESGGDVVETVKGTATIGQFEELPSCRGERNCPREMPAGSVLTAKF